MGVSISRKLVPLATEDRACQKCGKVFTCADSSRALQCPACVQEEWDRLEKLNKAEMKTEPPDLSLAAPPSFAANSVSQVANRCQPDLNNRTENGEPGLASPPRLPSLPFADEHTHDDNAESLPLGSTATYPTPPTSHDLVLSAFKLLKPVRQMIIRDHQSADPVLRHGSTGWPHRSAFCHCNSLPGLEGVELRRNNKDPHDVAIGGVQHCGDIWKCPVCSVFSAFRWQHDIIEAEKKLREDGFRLLLVVLTVSHRVGTSLDSEIELLRKAYTEVFSQQTKGQKKRAKRLGIVGRLRAWDVLYGTHGWHAHMNVLIAVDKEVDLVAIQAEIDRVYRMAIHKAGGFASLDHGVKVEEYKNGKAYMVRTGLEGVRARRVGDKFALGYEVISTDTKVQHGLSIGALRLASVQGYHQGDIHLTPYEAEQLCLEYAATMQGERSVISAGLIRETLKQVGESETNNEQQQTAPLLQTNYTIDVIIPSRLYHSEIVAKDRFVPLLQAMRAGPEFLSVYLEKIGIITEKRDISLQYASYDAHKTADEKDRERSIEGLERAALIWKGGGAGDTDSKSGVIPQEGSDDTVAQSLFGAVPGLTDTDEFDDTL